jgi:hypothetical protein
VPCYEPPRPDVHDNNELRKQINKYVDTLKDIEIVSKEYAYEDGMPPQACQLAYRILDIIDGHWK